MTDERTVQVETNRAAAEPNSSALSPLVDIYELPNEVVLVAEIPGVNKDSVSIQVDKGVLTLEAKPTPLSVGPEFAATYKGFESGPYYRAFALSDEIDRDKIRATTTNGVLTIHLPKAEMAKTRKIEIQTCD